MRPKTSRHPGVLTCELRVNGVPTEATSGAEISVTAHALNTGDTIWTAQPARRGGFVTLGCKLMTVGGRLLNDTLGRTLLPHDVEPGDAVEVQMSVLLPGELAAGPYLLLFDLVDEQICWFSDTSAATAVSNAVVIR